MTDASRQVLFAFDSGDSEDLVLACTNLWQIIPAVSQLAKSAMLSSPTRGVESAILVTTVAAAFSLARSPVEQQASTSLVLSALSDIVRIAFNSAPQFEGQSRDESRHQSGLRIANLLDELSRLPHATGMFFTPGISSSNRTTPAATPVQTSSPHARSVIHRHVCYMGWSEPSAQELDGQDGSIFARDIFCRPCRFWQSLGCSRSCRCKCRISSEKLSADIERGRVKNGKI
jgi:hypothetical protein